MGKLQALSWDFIHDVFLLQAIDSDEHVETVANTTVPEVDVSQPMILGDSQLYQIVYGNVLYYLVMYVIPLGTLALLNIRLIAALNAIKRRTLPVTTRKMTLNVDERQTQSHRRRRKDDNITLCVIVIVCVFIVCQTPALFNQIFWALFQPSERQCGRFHFYYTKLSDLLVVVNSSCNFVVYCLFGATFRRIFLSTVCCCCWCGCLGDTTSVQQHQQHQEQALSEVRTRQVTQTATKRATIDDACVVKQNKRTTPPINFNEHKF